VPGAAGGLARRASETGGAHVLNSGDGVGGEQLETGFERSFLAEGIANLHCRPILLRFLGEVTRGERGARQSITPGLGADVENWIPDPLRGAAGDLLVPQHAEAEDIHQRVAVVTFVEVDLAADRGNTDAVSVMCDAGDHAREKPAIRLHLRRISLDRAKAQ
jgi:hypothetical protein